MGSASGHIQAGLPYIILGLRWTYCALLRFFLCHKEASLGKSNPKRFKSSIVYPWSCKPNWPIDGVIIMVCGLIEVFGEWYLSSQPEYNIVMNGQHMLIFFCLSMAGFCIILKHFRMLPIPNLEYVLLAMTLAIMTFVLTGHILGKPPIEQLVHVYMGSTNIFILISVILECKYRHNIVFHLCRTVGLVINGTWTCVLIIFLFPPWDAYIVGMDEIPVMKVAMMVFMITILGSVLTAFALGGLAVIRIRNMTPPEVYEALEKSCGVVKIGNSGRDVEQCRSMLDDSDDY